MAFDFPSAPTLGQTYTPTGGPTYVWNGTAWVVLSSGSNYSTTVFTATASQTTFSTTYVVGSIYVYRNGVLLAPADFTATNGTSIVLANACNAGDTIEVINLAQVPYVNCVQKTGDTMTGTLNLPTDGLVVGTTQLVAASGNVGIGTAAPAFKVDAGDGTGYQVLRVNGGTTGGSAGSALYCSQGGTTNVAFGNSSAIFGGAYNADATVYAVSNLRLAPGGSEKVRIDTAGNVGIGTTSAAGKLQVQLATSHSWGTNWGSGTAVFGGGAASSGGLGVSYNDTDGAALGAIIPGVSWKDIKLYSNGILFYTGGSNERMRIDPSGNVGIGTSSPGTKLDVVGTGSMTTARVNVTDSYAARITLSNSARNWSITNYGGQYSPNGSFVIADETSGVVRMAINTSGGFSFGSSQAGDTRILAYRNGTGNYTQCGIQIQDDTANPCLAFHAGGTSAYMLRHERSYGGLDSVNSDQSAFAAFRGSAFNIGSDYRIKENIVPLEGATDRLKLLKPSRFSFKEGSMMYNEGKTVDGFVAHEVSPIVPEAVTGEKDGVNENGSILIQSLDQSKLIPLLTAALQESIEKIEALEARLAKLEGAA